EIELAAELTLAITNFSLKQPGTCAGDRACGHVQVHADGDKCNDTKADGTRLPYNEEAWTLSASADFLYCDGVVLGANGVTGVDGEHVISAGLYDDAESPVLDPTGKRIEDAITVTVQADIGIGGGGAGGQGGTSGAGGTGGA